MYYKGLGGCGPHGPPEAMLGYTERLGDVIFGRKGLNAQKMHTCTRRVPIY